MNLPLEASPHPRPQGSLSRLAEGCEKKEMETREEKEVAGFDATGHSGNYIQSELVNPIYAAGYTRTTSNSKPLGWGASPHRSRKNMNPPFSVSEDKVVREFKYREVKKKILPSIPRIALVGFSICIAVVVAVKSTMGLDDRTALICVLVPTPLMLLYTWASPLMIRYGASKWTMKEKKIQMSDGLYIPAKGFQMWSYSVEDFEGIEGYQALTLKAKSGLSKGIVLNDSTSIANLIEYLNLKGVNQSR